MLEFSEKGMRYNPDFFPTCCTEKIGIFEISKQMLGQLQVVQYTCTYTQTCQPSTIGLRVMSSLT